MLVTALCGLPELYSSYMDRIESAYIEEELQKLKMGIYAGEEEHQAAVQDYASQEIFFPVHCFLGVCTATGNISDERGNTKAMRDATATNMWSSYVTYTIISSRQ